MKEKNEKKEISDSIKFLRAVIGNDEKSTEGKEKSGIVNLTSFLHKNKEKSKTIITDDIQNVNNIFFRLCNDGTKLSDLKVVTIIDIAKEIVINHILSEPNASRENFKYLNHDSAISILGKILNDKKDEIKFVSEDSFCTATYREVYDNINLIRLNKGENYSRDNSLLKKDLELLIETYNKELKNKNYYDDARIILSANDYIKDDFVDIKNETYGFIDFNHSFSKSEKYLINKILGTSKEIIEIEKNKGIKEVVFKECYGYYNEVNEVLVDLKEKNISESLILYTDDIYYPYIKSIFGSIGVETSFTTGYMASNINFVKNIRHLLNFAINNYNYKDLKSLCLSNSMTFYNNNSNKEQNDKDEEKENISTKYISLIKEFEKGIGLGISCRLKAYNYFITEKDYKSFIGKQYSTDGNDVNEKFVISEEYYSFIKEIIVAFNQYNKDKSLSILLIALVKFVDKYKVKHSDILNKHNQNIKSKLFEISESLKFMSTFDDLREGLKYLDSLLEKLTISDQYEHGTIEVQKLNTTKVYNKKNIYILGLTAKQYLGNTAESPVLSDKNRKMFCEYKYDGEKYNLNLACDEEIMKKDYLFDTCDHLLDDSNINVYCSKFDQISNYPLSRAPIFNQLMEKYSVSDLVVTVFKYPIFENEYSFDADNEINSIKTELEKDKSLAKETKKEKTKHGENDDSNKQNESNDGSSELENNNIASGDKPIVISHSALSQFLNCQVQYYYSHIVYLSDENYVEMDHDKWLDPLKRGSMMHEILQKYVEKIFKTDKKKATTKKYGNEVQEDIFESMCDEVFKKYDNIQSASDFVKKKTKDDIKKKLHDYFIRMHQEFSDPNNEWYVEKCEVSFDPEFDEQNYKDEQNNKTIDKTDDRLICYQEFEIKDSNDKSNGKKEKLFFKGRIDRIDRSINNDNKIRIVDYKSGNPSKFIENIKGDRQHHIYALCFNRDKNKEVEFRYEFIDYSDYKDGESDTIINKYEIRKENLKEPLKKEEYDALKLIKNCETELTSLKYVASRCKYCKYVDICILKLSSAK